MISPFWGKDKKKIKVKSFAGRKRALYCEAGGGGVPAAIGQWGKGDAKRAPSRG